jgi:predicted PurR-regulated permease PerM
VIQNTNRTNEDAHIDTGRFIQRLLLVAGTLLLLVIVLYLLGHLAGILLVIFAGILLAVFLEGLTSLVCGWTSLPRGWGMFIVILLLVGAGVGIGWFAGPRMAEQLSELGTKIPQAVDTIVARIREQPWGERLLHDQFSLQDMIPSGSVIVGGVTGFFSKVLGVLGNLFVVLIIGLYLAISPATYSRNMLLIVPERYRSRLQQVLSAQGRALRYWLVGRIASMTVVGILTALGLWIAGVPLAMTLGLIAALFSFVPYIGPLAAAVPGVLIGAMQEPGTVWIVILVYMGVQLCESYLITPLIQQKAVSIPPALLITIQLLMGVLFGAIGVLLATPFAVVVIVAVQMLYIEDVLGENVTVLGENSE